MYGPLDKIYKDLVFSKNNYDDEQLRPNSCIAIAIAPELFDPDKAAFHMKIVDKYLFDEDSIGIKTLCKIDD